jgi:hypothetical protein
MQVLTQPRIEKVWSKLPKRFFGVSLRKKIVNGKLQPHRLLYFFEWRDEKFDIFEFTPSEAGIRV